MKFKTKFNMNDKVYFSVRGKTYSGIIKSISISVNEYRENEESEKLISGTSIHYRVAYKVNEYMDDYFYDKFYEKELYSSEEELKQVQENEKY